MVEVALLDGPQIFNQQLKSLRLQINNKGLRKVTLIREINHQRSKKRKLCLKINRKKKIKTKSRRLQQNANSADWLIKNSEMVRN